MLRRQRLLLALAITIPGSVSMFAHSPEATPLATETAEASGSKAQMVTVLPKGEYTLVVQVEPAGSDVESVPVHLAWNSDTEFLQSNVTLPAGEQNCRSRVPLLGFGSEGDYAARELSGFKSGSCGTGSYYALFAFRLEGDNAAVSFTASMADESALSVSLRKSCTDAGSEIECAAAE